MLWPASQQDSRANLRHALFVLRRLFETVPDAWVSTSHTLALNPDVVMVDVLALTGSYSELGYQERLSYDRGGLLDYMYLQDRAAYAGWRYNGHSPTDQETPACRAGGLNQSTARSGQEQRGKN